MTFSDYELLCFISSLKSPVNSETSITPRSPLCRRRTDTVSASASFSPTMSIILILLNSACRILAPILSALSSNCVLKPDAFKFFVSFSAYVCTFGTVKRAFTFVNSKIKT